MTQIGKSNVKWSEIRDALNKNGGSVSNNAEDAFKVSSKYQKWARWKPTDYDTEFHDPATGNWYVGDANCGVTIPKYINATTFLSDMNGLDSMDDLWIVDPPKGGKKSPYRLGDFAGHDLDSKIINNVSIYPETTIYPKISMMISFNFCDNTNPVNSGEGDTDWLDVRDFWMDSNKLTSSSFGYIAVKGNELKAKYKSESLNDSIIDGFTNQVLIDVDTTNFSIGTWTIYPVIFYTISTFASSGWEGLVSDFELGDGFVPLPCKPFTTNVVSFSNTVDPIKINDITYNTSGISGVYINATFINKSTTFTSHKDNNPVQVQVQKWSGDIANSTYEIMEYAGTSDNPQYFEFKNGSTDFTIELQYTIDESYKYAFCVWVKHNLYDRLGNSCTRELSANNGTIS